MWVEQSSIPEPPSGDTVFRHYYSELIHMVKVRPAPPRFQAPFPGLRGTQTTGLRTVNLSGFQEAPKVEEGALQLLNPRLLRPQVLGVSL